MNISRKCRTCLNSFFATGGTQFWCSDICRFESKFRKGKKTTCWIWRGSVVADGYGGIDIGGTMVRAHRFSYELYKGKIDSGKLVCHSCDNRLCVNPNHLWMGSNNDNMKDMKCKGRAASGVRNGKFTHPEKRMLGVKNSNAKLTEELVIWIRESPQKHNEVGDILGVSRTLVRLVRQRKVWAHVT